MREKRGSSSSSRGDNNNNNNNNNKISTNDINKSRPKSASSLSKTSKASKHDPSFTKKLDSQKLALEANSMEERLRQLKAEILRDNELKKNLPRGAIWKSSQKKTLRSNRPGPSYTRVGLPQKILDPNHVGQVGFVPPQKTHTSGIQSHHSQASSTTPTLDSPTYISSNFYDPIEKHPSDSLISSNIMEDLSIPKKVSTYKHERHFSQDVNKDEQVEIKSRCSEYDDNIDDSEDGNGDNSGNGGNGVGGLLWGNGTVYDEEESSKSFQEAVKAWRGEDVCNDQKSKTSKHSSTSIEIQTTNTCEDKEKKSRFPPAFEQSLRKCLRKTYFDKLAERWLRQTE